jgi:type IV pilus assembly protein PilF
VSVLVVGGCVTTESKGPKTGSSPQRVQAYLDLARGYLEKKDFVNARRPLEQALKIDPASAEAHVLMATVYVADGDKELAEHEYKAALSHDANDPMAQNNYGTFLFSEGRYKDAQKHLRLAAENSAYPRRAQAFENLGLTELKLNNSAAAEQAFQRALTLSPAQPRSVFELAELYFAKGDFTKCKGYFDSFNAMARPTSRSLWLGIRLSRALGDADQESSYALALRNLFPDSPEYRLYQDRNW